MELIKFEQLHAPYKGPESPSPAAQVKWLLTKQIPTNVVEQAMVSVYDELDRGKKFASGFELDRYLLSVAQAFHKRDSEAHLQALENFHQHMRTKWNEDLRKLVLIKKVPLWKKVLTLWWIR